VAITPEEIQYNRRVLRRQGFSHSEVDFYSGHDISTEKMLILRQARANYVARLSPVERTAFRQEMEVEWSDYVIPAVESGDLPDDIISDITSPSTDVVEYMIGMWDEIKDGAHGVFTPTEDL